LSSTVKKIKDYFTIGHERSIKVKKNILLSFILKGVSVVVSFLMVPITLNYLNVERYGIWLTLSSIIAWFYILDIGLGNGLRNKFTEALAKGNRELAKTYVSTTYAILGIIIIVFYVIFLAVNPFLNWVKILNTPNDFLNELNLLVFFVITFFCLQFFLKLIGTILVADQRPAISDLLGVVSSMVSLLIIYILTKTTNGSLLYLGTTFTVIPVIVYLLTSIILFSGKYKEFIPSVRYVDFKHGKELYSLGIKFFIIQISGIIIYSTSNIIITQVLGPAEVTPYNIAYKYFNTAMMFFMIIMTPFWSGFTEAYSKNDFTWIKSTMKKLNLLSIGIITLVVLMIFFADAVYKIWVGDGIQVPFLLTLFMGLYVMMLSWGAPFVFFMNGVGKIKLQLYIASVAAIINIPLSIFLIKYLNIGSVGIIISTCLLSISAVIVYPIQYKKILNKSANSIWNK
jgi:O-antigen/teichoic acid export membrane protein